MPVATGTGDGSSWEHAKAPSAGDWSALTAALAPGDTLHIGSGTYEKAILSVPKGGTKDAVVTLLGTDTGGGLPVFRGSWKKEHPAAGEIFCTLGVGARYVTLRNLRFENYLAACVTSGGNEGIVFSGLDARDIRFGLVFKNNASAESPSTWTRDVLVENCVFTGFTKSALRWEGGNRDFQIVNCHADAGGKPYDTDPFQMIYDIRGDTRKDLPAGSIPAHDTNFIFTKCSARNAYHEAPPGKRYWNGDGFVAERGVTKLTFIDCMAFDCTDGGWDLKATEVVFRGCIAFRNKRNIRLWGEAAMINCIAGYPVHRGGSGDAANVGIYGAYGSGISMDHCTLIGDATPFNIELKSGAPDAFSLRMKDCLVISTDQTEPVIGPTVKAERTTVMRLDAPPKGPVFRSAPSPDWNGKGTDFDPLPAYRDQGYSSTRAR